MKRLWILCVFFAFSNARTIPGQELEAVEIIDEEFFKIEPHIFENKILEAINKLKIFLQNGDPENGVPPMDPYFLLFQEYEFFIMDTRLSGYFKNTSFSNFSKFEVKTLEFKLIPLHFKVELSLGQLNIGGKYKMLGKIFNEIPINGTGKFDFETRNVSLSLYIKPSKVNSALQIKDLIMELKTQSVKINYTNELIDDKVHVLDKNLSLYILQQAQEKYFPLLLNMIKSVLNHFLLGYSFLDIFKLILQLLQSY